MAEKRVIRLIDHERRMRAHDAIDMAPEGYCVTISEPTRSLEQNAAMWPLLQAFADQLQWPVNGQMVWMTADEWKDVLSAAFKRESVRVAMGMDGGMVMLGSRTSKFSVREMSEFIEFLHATAAARDVDLHYMEAA
ncbi:recombination protein NinB [Xenophilus sp. Marseille-Q4582]|uniref:recombination protein NinB n=1 Tax=Xenophilus sp. Marseille-Q4582 TaxID=2866600 RepID=UPI001CE40F6E|nr:recombination protein NinB [Xenophilus sp. Marseille-Q4582]